MLFNEQGLKGATLADIAGSVGLVTNSVTYYYRKKEDLAAACLLRSIAAFDAVAAEATRSLGVSERLRAFFRGHAQVLADLKAGRHAPLIAFNDIRALPEPQAAVVFAAYTAMFRRVRTLLRGTETAHLGRSDLNARAHLVLSIANWMGPWIGRYEGNQHPRIADRVCDILVHGMAGPRASWSTARVEAARRPTASVDSTSEAFLRAATALIDEQGYRGASVDKISARLDLTKGSFYHHDYHKRDLIPACFERTFVVMRQALIAAEVGTGSGWQRACNVARELLGFQLSADGALMRATATSALPDTTHREGVRATLWRLSERMASIVIGGMVDGSVRPLDPAIAAQMAIAAINAAAELHRWVPGVTAETAADLYARPAFEGVLCLSAS